jgi:hypothetical protein
LLILTKKGDINPQKNSESPPGVFRFFNFFVVEHFKSCPRVSKLRI